MTTYTTPFSVGATAYISDKFYCEPNEALPCEIISYHINSMGIMATCKTKEYGVIPTNAKHLYATPEEAIEGRKHE